MNDVYVADIYSDTDQMPLDRPSQPAALRAFLDRFETVTVANSPVLLDSTAPLDTRRQMLSSHLRTQIETDDELGSNETYAIDPDPDYNSIQTPTGWAMIGDQAGVHHKVITGGDEIVCYVGIEEPIPPLDPA